MDRFKIYQIYYDEQTKKNCLEGFEPYYNEKCSEFFENDVILKLVTEGKHKGSEYFGIFSHSFQHKIHIWPEIIFRMINEDEKDVYSFFANMNTNNIFLKGDQWHDNFSFVCKKILEKIGYRVDIADPNYKTRCIVYQNHFVAKAEIYEDYVKTVLGPAIEIMNTDEEVRAILWKDAKYHKASKMKNRLKEQIGIDYYPYHPFVCERLFSFYMDMNPQITFKHLI